MSGILVREALVRRLIPLRWSAGRSP